MPKVSEHDARQACLADGLDPDLVIKGRPAWKMYTAQPEEKAEPNEIPDGAAAIFSELQRIEVEMTALDKRASALGDKLGKLIIGKRIENGSGIYQISYASVHYMSRVTGRGRKIVKGGKTGTQDWDLHRITPEMFKQ